MPGCQSRQFKSQLDYLMENTIKLFLPIHDSTESNAFVYITREPQNKYDLRLPCCACIRVEMLISHNLTSIYRMYRVWVRFFFFSVSSIYVSYDKVE